MDLTDEELESTMKGNGTYINCYHCGKNEQHYCEECYQKLIAENLRLQTNFNGTENEHNLLYKILLLIYDLEAQSESKKIVGYEVREFLRKFHKIYNLSKSIDCYLERLNTYEKIWKDYNLSRFYSIENKVIGTISIVAENICETCDFVSYDYDNDFLIVHLLNGIKYYPKNSILKIDVYFIKVGVK